MSFQALAWLAVLLPLIGWGLSFLAAMPRRAAQIALFFNGLSLLAAVAVLVYRIAHQSPSPYESIITFWDMHPVESGTFASVLTPMFGVRVDGLSTVMMVVVSLISAALLWHGRALMRADAEPRRFFLTTTILTFAAMGAVASPNLFQLWLMGVIGGICAYLLVAHWWTDAGAVAAARRLAMHLAVGDLALLFAVAFGFVKFGVHASSAAAPPGYDTTDPFSFTSLAGQPGVLGSPGEWVSARLGNVPGVGMRTLGLLGALFLVAVAVRTLQVPFHAWLGEAADAPPPGVGLVATLLPLGGIVLLARTQPLLAAVPNLLTVTAVVGAVTAVVAAAGALVQRHLVRLAMLSVIAQLGLVVAAVGAGGYSRPLFGATVATLLAALLFVAVPSVIGALRTQELREMGGLWPRMPWTSAGLALWAVGVAGGGLISYDALASILQAPPEGVPQLPAPLRVPIAVVVMAAVLISTVAAVAAVLRVCSGTAQRRRGIQPERLSDADPRLRRTVLAVGGLAVALVVVGAIPPLSFGHFVYAGAAPAPLPWDVPASIAALLLGAGGVALAWLRFRREEAGEGEVAQSRRPVEVVAARAADPAPVVAAVAGRSLSLAGATVAEFDVTVTDSITDSLGEGVAGIGRRVERTLTSRLTLQLAVALAATLVLVAAAVLGATGHLPGGGG